MGVDVKINQADLIGHMIADEMNDPSIMTLMRLSKGAYSMVRVHVDYHSPHADKAVADIKLPAQALLSAIYEDVTMIIPMVRQSSEQDSISWPLLMRMPLVS